MDRNGGRYCHLSSSKLFHNNSGQFIPASPSPWILTLHPISFACDSLGVFWISGLNNGISKFDGSTWSHYDSTYTSFFNSNNYVQTVFVDRDQNIWFGAYLAGVDRFNGNSFNVFDLCPTIGGNRVRDIDFFS